MTLSTEPPPQALAPTLGDGIRTEPLARSAASTRLQTIAALALVPMLAISVGLALTSDHLKSPVASALYSSYLTAASMLVGLYWWRRRPASRFGPLLVGFATLWWVTSWQASDRPLVFDIGVLAEGPGFAFTFYLFLAFPMGRLEPAASRWLMGFVWFVVLAFFFPAALLRPVISGAAPLTRCDPACPENALQIASAPDLGSALLKAEWYSALAVCVLAFALYLWRMRVASRPQRRALMAVAVTSLLWLPAFFVSNFSRWVLHLDVAMLDTLSWLVLVTRVLLPLGFLVALLQADYFAATGLRTLLERLAGRPSPQQWRDAVATALDDDRLRLGYHDPATSSYREPDGAVLEPPRAGSGRAWVPIQRERQPVAAMEIDETLAENPELVQAATTATVIAVQNGSLEGELQATRARVLEAGDAARRQIERDIHDTAQQRLVALRIQLTLAGEQLEAAQDRERLERLDAELQRAIQDLRRVAQGGTPDVLGQEGIGSALEAAVAHSPMPVRIEAAGLGRHPEPLESAVYFCCIECLQNAAKHAGRGAAVVVHLSQYQGRLGFTVEDDGIGFDPATVARGAGLDNLTDRVTALGGTLKIDSGPGRGTRVTGHLPSSPSLS
jgi:signal transduction histidine kinase